MNEELSKARRFLSRRADFHPILVGLTGSHYYGFPSPDSDLDLKGIHVAPLESIISLDPPEETIDETAVFEGQEIDFTSHELALALRLLLKGNGNILERILTPYQAVETNLRAKLVALAIRSISRRYFHHYRGFFGQKCRDYESAAVKTVKDLLYVYRSALTGIHLLATGELVGDVTVLTPRYGFPHVLNLVEAKRSGGEHGVLDATLDRFSEDRERLEVLLTDAHERSPLPEQPPNAKELSSFLVATRLDMAGLHP